VYKILEKKSLNNLVDQMKIYAPHISRNAKPGHFLILRVNEKGERIPLTIVSHDESSVNIIYQKLGFSTKLLGLLNVGDSVYDIVGPLGRAADIKNIHYLLAIAGGVGAAPLLPQVKEYYRKGVAVDLIIGAKSKEYLILLDEYKKVTRNIYLCTDDGSAGEKGFVTTVASKLLKNSTYDRVVSIGPLVMMKACVDVIKPFSIPVDVSLNTIMVDGTGMCGNCRVSIKGETRFACVDGPDFEAEGIDFDELISRQNFYYDEEHSCQLELRSK
jgi:ferredoxin--NADP+ reductase